jgi:hypothetical protein
MKTPTRHEPGVCGRQTVRCARCQEHRREHAVGRLAETCPGFDPIPCKQPPMKGRTACRLHGGMSLAGPASATFKTGRYSKYLPSSLAAKVDAAANDPQLLEHRAEIALVEVRVGELLAAVGETGSTRLWKDVDAKLKAIKSAAATPAGVQRMRQTLVELEDVVRAGLSASATWDELRETLELGRRLREAESKRMKDAQEVIATGFALGMMRDLVLSVKAHVTDPQAIARISTDFARITGRRDALDAERGG